MADPAPRADASHPLVAKVLAVTPQSPNRLVPTQYMTALEPDGNRSWHPLWGHPEPIAARQIGVVLRWAADRTRDGSSGDPVGGCACGALLDRDADGIDPPEGTP